MNKLLLNDLELTFVDKYTYLGITLGEYKVV